MTFSFYLVVMVVLSVFAIALGFSEENESSYLSILDIYLKELRAANTVEETTRIHRSASLYLLSRGLKPLSPLPKSQS